MRLRLARLSLLIAIVLSLGRIAAQNFPRERTFQQPKSQVEKAVQSLRGTMAGPLPTLEGFVVSGNIPLDHFQRAYYQSTVQVTAVSSATSLVRVNAKITAWYQASAPAKSGYQLLTSNGRLESDLLDRLAEQMGAASAKGFTNSVPQPESLISAPMPRIPESALHAHAPNATETGSLKTQTDAAEKHEQELTNEAKALEEILQNQVHPKNLAAVKNNGTPVLQSPNVQAKVLFAATAGDEFEILDLNANWVHVRISGLSRGWIRRSALEMPDEFAEGKPDSGSQASAAEFRLAKEQLAPFPGDWEPLRGKMVKIVTAQKGESAKSSSLQGRLEFAKSVFIKQYNELSAGTEPPAGVVLIFDSDDGGMMAATMSTLKQWQDRSLTDEGFWQQCFFDPPELLGKHP